MTTSVGERLSIEEKGRIMANSISKGLIYADILTAMQALNTYKENPKLKDIKNICAYHLQQATEKLIKAQIYSSDFQYNNRDLYTHDIAALISYVDANQIPFEIPKMIEQNCHVITSWEAGSRYDIHFSVRADTLEKHLQIISEWFASLNF